MWRLSKEHEDGTEGLAFQDTIAQGGYVGIVKQLKGVNWSDANALEFWIHSDGKGQRLIIQLNSNGEDFEADLQDIAGTAAPQKVRLPFTKFVGKNGGHFESLTAERHGYMQK